MFDELAITLERSGTATGLELVRRERHRTCPQTFRNIRRRAGSIAADHCIVFGPGAAPMHPIRAGVYALIGILRPVHDRRGCASVVLDDARVVQIFE